MARAIGSSGNSSVIYVNADRFKKLSDTAIKISYEGNRQITASQFAQFILDNFSDQAKEMLVEQLVSLTS